MKNLKHLIALTVALVFVGTASVFAQQNGGFRIVTNHPDFKIKVVRCEASGKTCVIDLILENTGSQDVRLSMYSSWGGSIAYDDEANQYNHFSVSIGSSGLGDMADVLLMSEVPVKARIQLEGVPVSATMFRRMDIRFDCREFGLDADKKVKFYNIPITHDGD